MARGKRTDKVRNAAAFKELKGSSSASAPETGASGEPAVAPSPDMDGEGTSAADKKAAKKAELDEAAKGVLESADVKPGGEKGPRSVADARRKRRQKQVARAKSTAKAAAGAAAGTASKAGKAGIRTAAKGAAVTAAATREATDAAAAKAAAEGSAAELAGSAGAAAAAEARSVSRKAGSAAQRGLGSLYGKNPLAKALAEKNRLRRQTRVARRAAKREAFLAQNGLSTAAGAGGLLYKLRMFLTRRKIRRTKSFGFFTRLLQKIGRNLVSSILSFLVFLVIVALLVAMVFSGSKTTKKGRKSCEIYLAQAQRYADDNSIGYSMSRRYHNPDMDCSSYVYYCLVDSGYTTKAILGASPFDTQSMASALAAAGFSRVDWDGSMDSLQRGDILINTEAHTEIYAGNGQDFGAHSDKDGAPGDSTADGGEVCLGSYYDGGWDTVMRPPAATGGHGALTGVAADVYDCLAGYGFSDEAIAGVLGNMKAESGMDPSVDGDDGCGTISLGLMQMVGGERLSYLSWCSEKGLSWDTTAAQMEWTFSGEEGTSSYEQRWMSPSRVRDGYSSAPGYESRFGSDWYRSGDEYKGANDVALAAFSWMACYEGCATGYLSHLDNRIAYANEFYDQIMQGGEGEDYDSASDAAKSVVDACRSTASPGGGLCAAWVTNVFSNAGVGYWGGNACDQYDSWCHSTDRSELKVGMIVATPSSSSGTAAGRIYGHVGIYIGDGKIMHNTGSIETWDLDDWISTYCKYHAPAWGWFGGRSLE